MADKENQTSGQGQQDATSSHPQHSQGQQNATTSSQQKGVEITLENLKCVMRSVAKEVFEEHRGQRPQSESSPQSGMAGKRKYKSLGYWEGK